MAIAIVNRASVPILTLISVSNVCPSAVLP